MMESMVLEDFVLNTVNSSLFLINQERFINVNIVDQNLKHLAN